MRLALSILILASLVACGDKHCPPIDDPIGPDFYGTSGGLCAGDCASQHVYRSGAHVQLIVSSSDACQVEGVLSDDLVAAIDELHAALLASEVAAGEPICEAFDVGQTWIEFEESLTFSYTTTCPLEGLADVDSRLAAALWALAECRSTEDVQPDEHCRPAY